MPFGYQPYSQPYQQGYQMCGQPSYNTQYGQQPQQTQQTGLNRVTGIEGARAFQVPPNSVVPLFDDTQDVFYIKTTDSGGFPTIRGYRFTPIEDAPQTQPTGLTRADVEQIVREEMQKHEQQFIPKQQQYVAPPEYIRPGNTSEHDSGVWKLHAGDAGPRPEPNNAGNAEQRQPPSGSTTAGTADGAAV